MNYDSPASLRVVDVTLTVTDNTALFTTTVSFNVTVVDINQGMWTSSGCVCVCECMMSMMSCGEVMYSSGNRRCACVIVGWLYTAPRMIEYPLARNLTLENRFVLCLCVCGCE